MIIETNTLSEATTAMIALTASLGVKIFAVLAVTIGLGVGLWFLYKTVQKAKESIARAEFERGWNSSDTFTKSYMKAHKK